MKTNALMNYFLVMGSIAKIKLEDLLSKSVTIINSTL